MKYTIHQERLMKVMEEYFYDLYPDFELPFTIERTSTRVSYRSKDGEPWFIEYGDDYEYNNCKWDITDKIQPIYDFFGDEAVEMFVKWFFGFDIKDKGTKEYNWCIY
jgi:hypothetical protein